MEYFVLIDGEIRSLIRNSLEKLLGYKLTPKKNKVKELIFKITIRVISSLIAIQLFKLIKPDESLKKYGSHALVCLFIYLAFFDKED